MGVEESLKEFGLNDKEIKVYLALLELGSSRVNEIASKAKIIRETTYSILKSLTEKSLVSYSIREGVRYFSALDPEGLLLILKDKQKKIQESLPELNNLKKFSYKKPKVEFYEGVDGLKAVYRATIRGEHKELYAFLNGHMVRKALPYFSYNITKERMAKGIKSFVLADNSPESEEIQKADKKEYRETRILKLINDMKGGIYLFGNSVAFLSFDQKEPMGIVIENETISHELNLMFKHFWSEGKK